MANLNIKQRSPEERILEELKKPRREGDNRATYKLELQFAKARTANLHNPNVCMLTIWESGKMMSGNGDVKMFWCGHDDCQMPIRGEFFSEYHVVCPSCKKENIKNAKERHILQKLAKDNIVTVHDINMPEAWEARIYKLTPTKMAQQLEKRWRDIGGDADIYVKFHPQDIRALEVPEYKKHEQYNVARLARNSGRYVIYPCANIMKDVAAGATLWRRFLALLTS